MKILSFVDRYGRVLATTNLENIFPRRDERFNMVDNAFVFDTSDAPDDYDEDEDEDYDRDEDWSDDED